MPSNKFSRKKNKLVKKSSKFQRAMRPMSRVIASRDFTIPLPESMDVRFKYVSNQYSLTTGVIGVAVHQYHLNSLFSPEVIGGHQPYGFDQLTPFYRRYRVNTCKVLIRFFDQSTDGCRVGYKARNYLDTYNTPVNTASAIRETPNSQVKVISTGGPASKKFVAHTFVQSELSGVSKIKHAVDDAFAADVTAPPVNKNYLDVFCSGPVDNTSGQNVKYTIEMIFDCTMYALKTQLQS